MHEEAEENNLEAKARNARFHRWGICGLCEQQYHGVVSCALGWACWKTYLGRPEADWARLSAMLMLGNGLTGAKHDADALIVQEAELAMLQRVGVPESHMLSTMGNLAGSYATLGRLEDCSRLQRGVYSSRLKIDGVEHENTLIAANNYAVSLLKLERFEEAKAPIRKTMPVARRVLGENHEVTLRMRQMYAQLLCRDEGATLDDLREAVATLEEIEPTARRVLGGAHPLTVDIEDDLQKERAALRARETPGDA